MALTYSGSEFLSSDLLKCILCPDQGQQGCSMSYFLRDVRVRELRD